jgi:hypothetical protein
MDLAKESCLFVRIEPCYAQCRSQDLDGLFVQAYAYSYVYQARVRQGSRRLVQIASL